MSRSRVIRGTGEEGFMTVILYLAEAHSDSGLVSSGGPGASKVSPLGDTVSSIVGGGAPSERRVAFGHQRLLHIER